MSDTAPNWDDLRVFLAVARAESLSGAGRVLKMDPAAASRGLNSTSARRSSPSRRRAMRSPSRASAFCPTPPAPRMR